MKRSTMFLVALAACLWVQLAGSGFALVLGLHENTFIPGDIEPTADHRVSSVVLSPDGSQLYAAYWTEANSPLGIYSTATNSLVREILPRYGNCHGRAIASSDNRYLFAPSYYEGDISRFDMQNADSRTSLSLGSWANGVCSSPNGNKLLVFYENWSDNAQTKVAVVNIASGAFENLGSVSLTQYGGERAAFAADSAHAYVALKKNDAAGAALGELDLQTLATSRRCDLPGNRLSIGLATCGNTIFVGSEDYSKVFKVDATTFAKSVEEIGLSFVPGAMAMLPDGRHLLVASAATDAYAENGILSIVDTMDNVVVASLDNLHGGIYDIAVSANGRTAYLANRIQTGGITVVDIVPEPSTCVLLGIATISLLGYAQRRRRAA